MISEEMLKCIGFSKSYMEDDKKDYYYTKDIGDICLITNAKSDIINDIWSIEIFDFCDIVISDVQDANDLICILERGVTNTSK